MSSSGRPLAIAATLSALLLTGCAAHVDRLREVRGEFYASNLEPARTQLEKYTKSYGREADNFKLDRAVVELSAGRPKEAERLLREVRDSFDYFEQASIAEKAAVLLTDDTHSAYAGEDYEKVLVRAMLAISNLMTGGDDATAYSLQADDKQEQIIQNGADESGKNPKLAYKRIALGAYLHGMLREANLMDYNEAARSFVKVCNWEPSFPYGRYDYERVTTGHHNAKGNGVLYVFALVGRGPYKEQRDEIPTQVAMLIADRIISATGRHTLPPTIAPVKVPIVVATPQQFDMRGVAVSVNRQTVGETATITDVTKLAIQQYAEIYPRVIARAVARRALKKGIIYGAKEGLSVGNGSAANLLLDLGGVAWEATEQADTRCWGLLPDRIQVMRVELPAGTHTVGLFPAGGMGAPIAHEKAVRIEDGRNTYILATFADSRLVGNILSSDDAPYREQVPPKK
jgi:uncharacterized protein